MMAGGDILLSSRAEGGASSSGLEYPHERNLSQEESTLEASGEPMPPLAQEESLVGRTLVILEKHPRRVLQAIFFLLGVGVLVPWNAFISAKAYFESRFCDPRRRSQPWISSMESLFGFCYNISSVMALGCILLGRYVHQKHSRWEAVSVHHAIDEDGDAEENQEYQARRSEEASSPRWFVVFPLTLLILIFAIQSILVVGSFSPTTMVILTLMSIAACGLATAMATAGVVAIAAQFHEIEVAMNPFLTGQSMGGLLVSVANFCAAWSEDSKDFWEHYCGTKSTEVDQFYNKFTCTEYQKVNWGTLVYFALGLTIFVSCLFGLACIDQLRAVLEERNRESAQQSNSRGFEPLDVVNGIYPKDETSDPLATLTPTESPTLSERSTPSNVPVLTEGDALDSDLFVVLGIVWQPAFAIFATFVVTLALFPAWTSQLTSIQRCHSHFRGFNDLYLPFTFVLFNAGDFTGRLLAGITSLQKLVSTSLVTASLLRFGFLPLLFMCTHLGGKTSLAVHSDVFSVGVQFVFAVSNGLLLTCAFGRAPSLLPFPRSDSMEERMSELLSFSLSFGLLAGSLCSFPVSKLE